MHNKDEKKALQRYEELQRRKAMFYLSRETAMTLSIVGQIAKVRNYSAIVIGHTPSPILQ